MEIKSSNNSKEKNFSQSLNIEKDNIYCKDGFCTLPNQNENPSIQKNKVAGSNAFFDEFETFGAKTSMCPVLGF